MALTGFIVSTVSWLFVRRLSAFLARLGFRPACRWNKVISKMLNNNSSGTESLEELLVAHRCAELVQNQKPILIDSKASIEEACEVPSWFACCCEST